VALAPKTIQSGYQKSGFYPYDAEQIMSQCTAWNQRGESGHTYTPHTPHMRTHVVTHQSHVRVHCPTRHRTRQNSRRCKKDDTHCACEGQSRRRTWINWA
jgi:hypothetical protein